LSDESGFIVELGAIPHFALLFFVVVERKGHAVYQSPFYGASFGSLTTPSYRVYTFARKFLFMSGELERKPYNRRLEPGGFAFYEWIYIGPDRDIYFKFATHRRETLVLERIRMMISFFPLDPIDSAA